MRHRATQVLLKAARRVLKMVSGGGGLCEPAQGVACPSAGQQAPRWLAHDGHNEEKKAGHCRTELPERCQSQLRKAVPPGCTFHCKGRDGYYCYIIHWCMHLITCTPLFAHFMPNLSDIHLGHTDKTYRMPPILPGST